MLNTWSMESRMTQDHIAILCISDKLISRFKAPLYLEQGCDFRCSLRACCQSSRKNETFILQKLYLLNSSDGEVMILNIIELTFFGTPTSGSHNHRWEDKSVASFQLIASSPARELKIWIWAWMIPGLCSLESHDAKYCLSTTKHCEHVHIHIRRELDTEWP